MSNVVTEYAGAVRPFRGKVLIAILLGGLGALAEGAALGMLIPILSSDSTKDAAALESSSDWVITTSIASALIGFILLAVFSALVRYSSDALTLHIKTDIEIKARRDMTEALVKMTWPRFMHLNQGDISKALVVEGLQIGSGIQQLISGLSAGVAALCYFAVAVVVSLHVASMAAGFAGLIYLVHRFASKRTQESAADLSKLSSEIGDASAAIFGNLKYFRSTGFEDVAKQRAHDVFDRFAQSYLNANIQPPRSRAAIEALGALFIAMFLAAQMFVFRGSAVEALVALAIFYRMAPRLLTLQSSFLQARSVLSWLHTYEKRLALAKENADSPLTVGRSPSLSKGIRFHRVTFAYPDAPAALSNVTIDIPHGTHTALVGESGSGKSTLVDLVSGLLTPLEGKVQIDDDDLATSNQQAWRRCIGIVMQDSMLLNDTVARNVAFCDSNPDEARVIECLKLANAWGFVSSFTKGIHEPIAERGARLSGGQRQRLAIARALYHRPALLILDEATSALDSGSEREFQAAIESLEGKLTILSIAHRLNTIRHAHCIYVLKGGTVTESGDWDSLVQQRGEFHRLLNSPGSFVQKKINDS
jgi:ABC-type multidrug transport system fused ATPase/permease subunit